MKKLISTLILPVLSIVSCVGPPDYSDGLLENKPAVINENNYFSLSLLGDSYTEDNNWNLLLNTNSSEVVLTTLVIRDLNNSSTDSTFLIMINEFEDTLINIQIFDEIVYSSLDSIIHIGTPAEVIFKGKNFTGRLEYQILINQ